jgi:glyoxylase-like metal-dependent hydrolase (beta-lactamase superfamily II)
MGGRIIVAVGVGVVALAVVGAGFLARQVTRIDAERIAPDVHVLTGLGGNVGVLRTDEGAVVVDSLSLRLQGERVRARAEELGGGPVQALINTHWHGDHTHGNPGFDPETLVVATRRTLDHLRFFDADAWQGEAEALLPRETFRQEHEMRIGGKTVRSLHLGRGHTDGDLVVLFVEDRVIHTGDLVFNQRYPNIDLASGGSIEAWIGTLDRVLELDFDRVIPGHGAVTDADGIRRFQAFLRDLWSAGQRAAAEGWTLEETRSRAVLTADAGFDAISVPLLVQLDRPFVLQRAWEEATGAVAPLNPEPGASPAR